MRYVPRLLLVMRPRLHHQSLKRSQKVLTVRRRLAVGSRQTQNQVTMRMKTKAARKNARHQPSRPPRRAARRQRLQRPSQRPRVPARNAQKRLPVTPTPILMPVTTTRQTRRPLQRPRQPVRRRPRRARLASPRRRRPSRPPRPNRQRCTTARPKVSVVTDQGCVVSLIIISVV